MGDGPQQISTRTIARVFFTLVVLAVSLYFIYLIRHVLGLIFIAVFLAVALGPAVDFFARRHAPRAVAILGVFLAVGFVVFLIGLVVVPPVVDQVQELADDAPGYIADLRENRRIRDLDDRFDITTSLEEQAATLPNRLDDAAGALQAVTVGVFSTIVQFLIVITITFFLLLDGRRIFEGILDQLGPETRARASLVAADVYRSVGGYVAGAFTIATVCALVTYVTLTALGVPFAVPLAVLAGFLDLIPLVGATLAAIIVSFVTLIADFPQDTIIWVIVAVLYQQLETNFLQPQVYRRTVDLHPLVVIVAILVGASLLGVLGALVAIPIAAATQILLRDWWRHRRVTSAVLSGRDGEPMEVVTPDAAGAVILPREAPSASPPPR